MCPTWPATYWTDVLHWCNIGGVVRPAHIICAELAEDPRVRRGRLIAELRRDHGWTYKQVLSVLGGSRGSAWRYQKLASDRGSSDNDEQ